MTDILLLPSKQQPISGPGWVQIWGCLCAKCGHWWMPSQYAERPKRCPNCNNERWWEPKQGQEPARPLQHSDLRGATK